MTLGLTDGVADFGIYRADTANMNANTGIGVATGGGSSAARGKNKIAGVTKTSSKSGLVGVLPALSLSSQTLGKYYIRF